MGDLFYWRIFQIEGKAVYPKKTSTLREVNQWSMWRRGLDQQHKDCEKEGPGKQTQVLKDKNNVIKHRPPW